MSKFTPVDNPINITPEMQQQFTNQALINHRKNMESLTRPNIYQVAHKPISESDSKQDVQNNTYNINNIKYENTDSNEQLKILNDTVSQLRTELEEERKKNKRNIGISFIINVIIAVTSGLIVYYITCLL